MNIITKCDHSNIHQLSLCPDPALSRGKGLVTIEQSLGCAELAVLTLNDYMLA